MRTECCSRAAIKSQRITIPGRDASFAAVDVAHTERLGCGCMLEGGVVATSVRVVRTVLESGAVSGAFRR